MLKNISSLELIIENKFYRFYCDADSSLPHVKEALFQFQKFIGNIEDQANAMKSASEANKEEPKEDPLPE
jgi:hypothetical protein